MLSRARTSGILVAGGDELTLDLVRGAFVPHGYRVMEATTGQRALGLTKERDPCLVVIDQNAPDLGPLEMAGEIRQVSQAPIIVLSGSASEADVVAALDRGANDYVVKPFRRAELLARMRAALRGFLQREEAEREYGDFRLLPSARRVTVRGRELKLTATEYQVLAVLIRAEGSVVRHEQLLREVWGPSRVTEVAYLRVYMHHLRDKLEPERDHPKYLLTEPGIGYRLLPKPEED